MDLKMGSKEDVIISFVGFENTMEYPLLGGSSATTSLFWGAD